MTAGLAASILERIYSHLAVGQTVRPADLIFVLAGLPERKRYGWELFRRGWAPALLLSVARSEARFLKVRAGLPDDGNIVSLLPIRPEQGNHIFLWAGQEGIQPEIVRLPEANTFGELWALCSILRQRAIRHLLLLSTDIHLRRIRYAVGQLPGLTSLQITYVGVPEAQSICRRHQWWCRPTDARLVLSECLKLTGYHVKYGVLRRHRGYAGSQRGSTCRAQG